MKVGVRLGRIAEAVLVCLDGWAAAGLSQSPAFGARVFRHVCRRLGSLRESNYRRTVRKLEKRGLVVEGRYGPELTKSGAALVAQKGLGIKPVEPPARNDWDGFWRVVSFDVRSRLPRDLLRAGLKRIGFRKVQQSVWAHPSDCRKTVANLVASLGLDRRVCFIVSDQVDGDRELRGHFGI